MTEYSEPHDGKTLMAEEGWTALWAVVQAPGIAPDFPTSLEVYTNNDGRQVRIRPGVGFIKGHRYRNDADILMTVPANTSGSIRRDTIALRFHREEGRIYAGYFVGGANGVQPNLGTTNEVFDMPLANLNLPNNFTSVTTGMIADRRTVAGALTATPKPLQWFTIGGSGAAGWQNGYGQFPDAANEMPRYSKDSLGIVRVEGLAKKGTGSAVAFTLPMGFRPKLGRVYVVSHGSAGGATPIPVGVIVASDGRVIPLSSGTGWVQLAGISFEAEQ